jgi:hypothetical protein
LRVDDESFLAGIDRFGPLLLAVQGDAEVTLGIGVIRVEFDGLAEGLDGLAIIFQVVAQEGAEVAVSLGIVWVELDRLLVRSDGLVQLPLPVKGDAEVNVGADFRVESDGPAVSGDRFVQLLLVVQGDAEVVVSLHLSGSSMALRKAAIASGNSPAQGVAEI